jgi:hypothetical protein
MHTRQVEKSLDIGRIYLAGLSQLSDVEGHSRHERENKVVVLIELCRAIICTTKITNHVTQSHVRIQFTVYRVKQGARLT